MPTVIATPKKFPNMIYTNIHTYVYEIMLPCTYISIFNTIWFDTYTITRYNNNNFDSDCYMDDQAKS